MLGLLVAAMLFPAGARAEPDKPVQLEAERRRLVDEKQFEQAFALCRSWEKRSSAGDRAESHKCAANVFVAQANRRDASVFVSDARERLFAGSPASGPIFDGPAISSALDELDLAAQLTPQDLGIHQGRMFLALRSGAFPRAVQYLEAALKARPSDPVGTWAEYIANFLQDGGATHGAKYAELLHSKYGGEDLLMARGKFLVLAGRPAEAIAPLQKVVAQRPKEPRGHWLLARALEEQGELAGADKEYAASIKLDRGSSRSDRLCVFAGFVAKKRNDPARSATLAKQGKCR